MSSRTIWGRPGGLSGSSDEEEDESLYKVTYKDPEPQPTLSEQQQDLPSWPPVAKTPPKPSLPQPRTSPPRPQVLPKATAPPPPPAPLRNGEQDEDDEEEEEEDEEEEITSGSGSAHSSREDSPRSPAIQQKAKVVPVSPVQKPQPQVKAQVQQAQPQQRLPPPQQRPPPQLRSLPQPFRMTEAVMDDMRLAILQGNLPLVRDFIRKGVSVNQVLNADWTPLMYACSRGQHEIVRLLLQEGADPNCHKDMYTALMVACSSAMDKKDDILECIECLMAAGAKVNVAERHKLTPLMFACREGKMEVVQKLLAAEADIEKKDNHGWTALMWAANKGHGHVVRVLLTAGADPAVFSNNGQTAADIAQLADHIVIADILHSVMKHTWKEGQDPSVLNGLGPSGPKQDNSQITGSSTFSELDTVLMGLQLSDYIPMFHRHKITFETFLRMDEADLEKIGIQEVGVCKSITDAIKKMHLQEWDKSSLPALGAMGLITCPDAVAMLANIAKHLKYIGQSVGYLRTEIDKSPKILELGKETAGVKQLITQVESASKTCSLLQKEISYFHRNLAQIQDNVELMPADTVPSTAEHGKKVSWKKRFLVVTIIVGMVGGYVTWKKPEPVWSQVSTWLPSLKAVGKQ